MRLLTLFFLVIALQANAQTQQWTAGEIQQAIKKLDVLGAALYLAAHPDDENTRMIAWLANDRKAHTAYLSLTRGDGGQNLIGPEIRELLGIIRTQELLKARSVDGGHQYFSRANDFGFSKNPEETLEIWDKEKVLADVVWTIRKMQPDVIINRFPHTPAKTHGHHTASAQLSYEAFDAAADPNRFPEQLKYVDVWQAKRLLFNDSYWFYDSKEKFAAADHSDKLAVDVGTFYPLLGKSNNEIAGESRSQHQCQGMGTAQERGTRMEYLAHLKGDKASKDIFDNIDVTWNRLGANKISEKIKQVDRNFRTDNPALSVPALLELLNEIEKLADSNWKTRKTTEVKELIYHCLGLFLEATATHYSATRSDRVSVNIEALNRSKIQVELLNVKLAYSEAKASTADIVKGPLSTNKPSKFELAATYPKGKAERPYWLQNTGTVGMYVVQDQQKIGLPQNPDKYTAVFEMKVIGTKINYTKPILFKEVQPVKGEVYRPFVIAPHLSVNASDKAMVFAGDKTKTLELILKSGRENMGGEVLVKVPNGWKVDPAVIPFDLKNKGDEKKVSLKVSPPSTASSAQLAFTFNNKTTQERIEIAYGHIPTQLLFLDTKVKLERLDLKTNNEKIGYYMGAGDQMPGSLRQIGYDVTLLEDSDMALAKLATYDAVIIGIRAYNTKPRLKFHKEALMSYVKQGGNLIVQYNTNHRLITEDFAPYPLTLSRDRVTDETAMVSLLKPAHPVLNTPNKISAEDFEGWVQERGLYFPSEWADNYEAILSMHDKGETPKESSLLVAKHGKGNYIYTGISWFRELPAAVPGAYRLFANLIALK